MINNKCDVVVHLPFALNKLYLWLLYKNIFFSRYTMQDPPVSSLMTLQKCVAVYFFAETLPSACIFISLNNITTAGIVFTSCLCVCVCVCEIMAKCSTGGNCHSWNQHRSHFKYFGRCLSVRLQTDFVTTVQVAVMKLYRCVAKIKKKAEFEDG